MGPGAVFRGIVARLLPTPFLDDRDSDKPARLRRYGDVGIEGGLLATANALNDEGTYVVTTNPTIGTGFTFVAAQTAFSDTAPNIYIQNNEQSLNVTGKAVYLHYIRLLASAAATTASSLQYAIVIDPSPRALTTNNMTQATLVTPNTAVAAPGSVLVYVQNSATVTTLGARSTNARMVARGAICVATAPAVNALDTFLWTFGEPMAIPLAAATAGVVGQTRTAVLPPVEIGPNGGNMTMHLWLPASTASFNPEFEIGFYMK
jgi:hypothetical protein